MGDGTNSLERIAERLEERAGAREGAGCGLWAIRLWAMGQTAWSEGGGPMPRIKPRHCEQSR